MMIDLIESFKRKSDVTYTEDIIASYIIDNYSEVTEIEAKKLADQCHVGVASVTRFIKKMGYRNYNEFRIEMAKDYHDYLSNKLSLDKPFSKESSYKNILSQLPYLYEKANRFTEAILDPNMIDEIVTRINVSVVLVFASGQNKYIADIFSYKLEGLGVVCKVYETSHTQFVSLLSKSNTKTLAIVLTHTGTNPAMVESIDLLQKYKITTVLISGYGRNTLQSLKTKYHLMFYSGNPENRFANVIWGSSMQYVLDVLAIGTYVKRLSLLDVLVKDNDYRSSRDDILKHKSGRIG